MLFRYINNAKYLEFIYLKGLFLIKNIYILLNINCVNDDTIKSIVEKAYVYFIEFIIQININSVNFELTMKDAVLFTYKKTILSYKLTKSAKKILPTNFDNNLNILCNIFYITNNVNFIDYLDISTESYSDMLITKKICSIKTAVPKILELIVINKDVLEFNNILLNLRDTMETTVETLYNDKCVVKDMNYNINMLNNIHIIIDKLLKE